MTPVSIRVNKYLKSLSLSFFRFRSDYVLELDFKEISYLVTIVNGFLKEQDLKFFNVKF